MAYPVYLTRDAVRDLEELYDYIAAHDKQSAADQVLNEVEKVLKSLPMSPERGSYTKELLTLGIREYRELYFGLCRIIDRISDEAVFVLVVADGRRDMETLFQRRLFQA